MSTEWVYNGQEVTEEEFMQLLDESQDAMIAEQNEIANAFHVSDDTAGAIMYLRTRSRWTQEKENLLISRDHAGNPISLGVVLSGDF